LSAIILFACVVGHAFDTRDGQARSRKTPPPKAARTILTGSGRVKNPCACGKPLIMRHNMAIGKDLARAWLGPFSVESDRVPRRPLDTRVTSLRSLDRSA
jgi:hypothetical protein